MLISLIESIWISDLSLYYTTFSLIALRPMAICKFCFTSFLTLYCSSSWALLLTWASIFCLALLILLSFWVILFTLAATCLPITPTSTFPSLLRSRHIFLTISYTLRMYASHTGIWSSCPNHSSSFFFFFFTLTCYSFCLSYETLSWSIEWSKPSFWNNTRIFLFPRLTQHTHPVQIILTLS